MLDIERRYEVVVAVAPHPMDCNFYQTNKAIQSGALAVKDGGVLIVVSECPFGLGENQTLFDMLAAAEFAGRRPWSAPTRRSTGWECSRPPASPRILQRADIWTVTALGDEEVTAMFMIPFASVQEAVDAALRRQGPGRAGALPHRGEHHRPAREGAG